MVHQQQGVLPSDPRSMRRSFVVVSLVTACAASVRLAAPANAQDVSPLAGVWTLNPSLSEMPREIGFDVAWFPSSGGAGQNAGATGGGRGRRGSGNSGGDPGPSGAFSGPRESYDDARRVQLLTAEARNPPVRLSIVDTAAAVPITTEMG